MQRPEPMNRLLQGDVGAGKTIVALLAALVAMENGVQVAFMAPTEILADQHYLTIRRLLDASRFRVASLTGSVPAAKRREVLAELQSGALHLVVGTHALAEPDVRFPRPWGWSSSTSSTGSASCSGRALRDKAAHPDVLVMTATPIPRTLALTAFGDLDVSVIRGLPPGRQPVKTMARPESRRDGDLSAGPGRPRTGPAGLRHLSARRGFREGRPARGHGHGRSPAGGGVSGVPRRPAARAAQAGRKGSRDGRLRAGRRRTCSCRRPSWKWASTCRMPR